MGPADGTAIASSLTFEFQSGTHLCRSPSEPRSPACAIGQSSDRPSQRTRTTSLIGDAPRKFRKSGESTLLFANW